jgi:hypothetical protein
MVDLKVKHTCTVSEQTHKMYKGRTEIVHTCELKVKSIIKCSIIISIPPLLFAYFQNHTTRSAAVFSNH